MITVPREQQHRDAKLRDACRIFLWENWLMTFGHQSLAQNYTKFNWRWRIAAPQIVFDYRSERGLPLFEGYSEEELLKNRENYYCGKPTFFSQSINEKFGYQSGTVKNDQ